MTTSMHARVRNAIALTVAVLVLGCAGAGEVSDAPAGTALIPIRNARIPMDGVLSGGQPTPEQLEQAAQAGFRTVINIRTPDEEKDGYAWEAAAVERLGMTYVHIPIGGPETMTRANVERIDAALRAALADGPVLYHCASGNRIGATLALRAAWIEGKDPVEAFAHGRATGMTRLTEPIREILDVPPERD